MMFLPGLRFDRLVGVVMGQVEIVEVDAAVVRNHIVVAQRGEHVDVLDDVAVGFEEDIVVIIPDALMHIAHMDDEIHLAFTHTVPHLPAHVPLRRGIDAAVAEHEEGELRLVVSGGGAKALFARRLLGVVVDLVEIPGAHRQAVELYMMFLPGLRFDRLFIEHALFRAVLHRAGRGLGGAPRNFDCVLCGILDVGRAEFADRIGDRHRVRFAVDEPLARHRNAVVIGPRVGIRQQPDPPGVILVVHRAQDQDAVEVRVEGIAAHVRRQREKARRIGLRYFVFGQDNRLSIDEFLKPLQRRIDRRSGGISARPRRIVHQQDPVIILCILVSKDQADAVVVRRADQGVHRIIRPIFVAGGDVRAQVVFRFEFDGSIGPDIRFLNQNAVFDRPVAGSGLRRYVVRDGPPVEVAVVEGVIKRERLGVCHGGQQAKREQQNRSHDEWSL